MCVAVLFRVALFFSPYMILCLFYKNLFIYVILCYYHIAIWLYSQPLFFGLNRVISTRLPHLVVLFLTYTKDGNMIVILFSMELKICFNFEFVVAFFVIFYTYKKSIVLEKK